ncbi:hypothetical protein [Geodermatophilus sp. DSM 44513]|uniref:hypothetical protein n=1 Tax=Geodermatophilus sp. DSM 44513 TaxID=1528104 RepID=UPI001277A5E1|nr:hypothetical protein [Geodermatophilus sp. DSM 44513]WNV75033.1 hypothetical protein RTG05_18885 [Geodermatophilus sp. DSM 44513]
MSTPPGGRGEGRRDPETGGRPLADILREAGVESPTRGRRRRGDEFEDTGVRQRGTGDTGRVAERPEFGRRAGDQPAAPAGDGVAPATDRRRPAEPSTAAIPGLRPSRKPGVPGAATAGAPDGSPRTGTVRERAPRRAAAGSGREPQTGPIPVVRGGEPPMLEDGTAGAGEGVLAWVRFGGELVLALAAGVGTFFLFTVLWQQLPYLAVLLVPVAVAALVGGVGVWRQRLDQEPAGVRLVAVLVFAGTLLTIAPAAGLLATG